ncbi:MAG: hypothetical protein JXB35_05290 [Anaerolineae bacterium]|nr:hypothetical protein [Anaerolineae bacterium]
MFVPYSIVNPLTRIEITRQLPRPGETLVREGEVVESFQTVAEITGLPEFAIVNVSRDLAIPPKNAKRYLETKVGDTVQGGAILASRGGLGGRVCRAPFEGTITGYGRGRLLLEAPSQPQQLSALVPGTVARVIRGRAVVIETRGAFIQGIWGNGEERYGVLRVLARSARKTLRAKRLDASAQGAIVVGGADLDEDTLDQAIEMQVGGLILGSVQPTLIPRLLTLTFPILVTSGIGKIPMSEATFKLLKSLEGREAAVCASHPELGLSRPGGRNERPYLVIPMPAQSGMPIDPREPLRVGSRVGALRQPYLGMSGVVKEMPMRTTILETGARVPCAKVEFEGEIVSIPYMNLERLL